MSHEITTLVAIYAKDADTFALDAAIGEALPGADVKSRYLDNSNPHDEEAKRRGFDAITTVKVQTPRGPVPRFGGLFNQVLQPFYPRIDVHCIERDEEDSPKWVSRFDVEAPWRDVGPGAEIKTRVMAYADEQSVQEMYKALSKALPDANVGTEAIAKGEQFETRNGKMSFNHAVIVYLETPGFAGIADPFDEFIAPVLSPFSDRMVLLGRQGLSDDMDQWDYVGVVDLLWRPVGETLISGDPKQSG